MRFYVEGSPSGPESFRTESGARTWAQAQADRFGTTTTLHSSATGHTGIHRGWGEHSAGQVLASFNPTRTLSIDLSPEEVVLLRSALESAEYWEHRDVLAHDSGYILEPVESDLDDEGREAWAEVQAMRALDKRLGDL